MQVNEYYIPATQTYSRIEPAFASCEGGQDYLIPFAWGAISRVVGGCQMYRGDVGQCLGTFHSQDVDTRDTPWACLASENVGAQVTRVGATSPGPDTRSELVALASQRQKAPDSTLRTLQDATRQVAAAASSSSSSSPSSNSASNSSSSSSSSSAAKQGRRLYMSYDVFDPAFLVRGTQSSSDPAGWTVGVPTYVNLRQQAQASTLTADEPWGQGSSYGNYSAYPSSTLTSSRQGCGSGNCVLGQYA